MKTVPRILIATAGSLGDLNPMLAIGEQLLARGAEVNFATLACYEDACRKNGFGFRPLGNSDDYVHSLQYTREMLDERSFELFVDRTNFDQLELVYAQLLSAAADSDVLVAPSHVVAAHLVAEKGGFHTLRVRYPCFISNRQPSPDPRSTNVSRHPQPAGIRCWVSFARTMVWDAGCCHSLRCSVMRPKCWASFRLF